MSAQNDVATLRRQIDALVRAATNIRRQASDLYLLGWEPYVGETLAGDSPGFESRPPRSGNPRARDLFDQIAARVAMIEAELAGFDKATWALFATRAERPEPTRGSTISVVEFDYRIAKQKTRPDTPARIEPQPQHPGKRR